jgi:hypothetical protein
MGNMPHPVLLIASFAKEIAVCEATQSAFRGETSKYLHEIDKVAPGYLKSSEIDPWSEALVREAANKDLSRATEAVCRERIFPIAKKALDALPCYRDRDFKECPPIN